MISETFLALLNICHDVKSKRFTVRTWFWTTVVMISETFLALLNICHDVKSKRFTVCKWFWTTLVNLMACTGGGGTNVI
jgi:hypothetical protein